jgi:hypothetical protein
VTFREAAALGIDDLEHGLVVSTDFVPDKKADACPPSGATTKRLAETVDPKSPEVQLLVRELVPEARRGHLHAPGLRSAARSACADGGSPRRGVAGAAPVPGCAAGAGRWQSSATRD